MGYVLFVLCVALGQWLLDWVRDRLVGHEAKPFAGVTPSKLAKPSAKPIQAPLIQVAHHACLYLIGCDPKDPAPGLSHGVENVPSHDNVVEDGLTEVTAIASVTKGEFQLIPPLWLALERNPWRIGQFRNN